MAEDCILTSPLDSNIYRYVTLKNGLKVILISDSASDLKEIQGDRTDAAKQAYKRVLDFNEKYLQIKPTITIECPSSNPKSKTTKAFERVCRANSSRKNRAKDIYTVSLCIAVGSCNDPPSAPGLAHLCEHAIFLGSEKYQELEALQNYLEDHGGEINAFVVQEYTTMYLTVPQEGLAGALDILVDLITKPMFREDRVLKEVASIDAEFELKRLEEQLRLVALQQTFVKKKHPLGSFTWGNERSFDKKKVCDQLKAFWKDHFYANFMTLVIKGPETVCKLQSLAKKYFENIRTTEDCSPASKIAKFGTQPFDMEKWRKLYKVIPDGWPIQKLLKVSWSLDPEIWKNYETKPILYLEAILENKSEGGLVNVLSRKGLISKLTVNEGGGNFLYSNFCSVLTIEISLTDEGVMDYVEVLKYLFGYLKLLRERGPSEEFFRELKILSADIFHYSSDSNLESSLGSNDPDYDGSILLVRELSLIAHLKPPRDIITSKFLVTKFDRALIASVLEKLTPADANYIISADDFDINFPKKEKWFDLRFKQECPDFIEQLVHVDISPELKLPPKNELLTDTLCFPLDADHTFHAHLDHVTMKTEDKRARVRYVTSKCVRGYLPTARYNFHLTSNILDPLDPGVDASLATWAQCCTYCLDSKLGTALSGLITCFVSSLESSIYLQLFGPSNKLPNIFEIVVKTMFTLEKEINKETFKNMAAIVIDGYMTILNQYDKFAQELENLTVRDRFVSIFKKKHFLSEMSFERFMDFCWRIKNDMYIYGTLRGCITKLQSDKIMQELTKLPYGLWEGSRSFPNRAHGIVLPVGERCIRVKAHNPNETNSFVKNHYQFGQLNASQALICSIISDSLKNFSFLTLRSVEQLGYVTEVDIAEILTVDCLLITLHSPAAKYTTGYMDERMDNMLRLYYKKYIVDEKSFKKNLQALCTPDEKLTHRDTLTFFQEYLLVGGKNFRKLSTQVVGWHNCKTAAPKDTTLIPEKIAKYKSKKKFIGNKPPQDPWCLVDFDLPEKLHDENGYFITNFNKFTASMECYGLIKTYPPSDPDTSDDEIEIESVSGDDSSDQSDDSIWDDKK